MNKIDLEQLKKENPELHRLVIMGKIARASFPGIDGITGNFPVKGKEEKEIFQDAITGFLADAVIESLAPDLHKLLTTKIKK